MDILKDLPRLVLGNNNYSSEHPRLSLRCVVLGLSDEGCGGPTARVSLHIRDIHIPDNINLLLARTRTEAADQV